MDAIVLEVFVSLMLVAGGLLLFHYARRAKDFEHADALALKPLEEDLPQPPPSAPSEAKETR